MDRPALPPVDVTLVRIPFIPRLGKPTSTGGKSSHVVSAALGSSVVVLEGGTKRGGKHDRLYCNRCRQTKARGGTSGFRKAHGENSRTAVEVQSSTARSMYCIMRHEDCGDIDEREKCEKTVKGKRRTKKMLEGSSRVSRRCQIKIRSQKMGRGGPARNTETRVKGLCDRP